MTKFLDKSFSVATGSKSYRKGWERTFGDETDKDEDEEVEEDPRVQVERELFEAGVIEDPDADGGLLG